MWYEGPPAGTDPRPTKVAAVRDFVITLAQPNGVIQTLQRRNRQAGTMIDPRYACLLDNYEFRRGYDPKEFARVKDCLSKAVESDPAFALGFAALSRLHVSSYDAGFVESRAVLDDALRLAQRAVELMPESARAQAAMMSVQFARRDFAAALEAGKKAVALNPYDMIVLADYAYRLVRIGDIEQGAALLQEAAAYEAVRTPRVNFYLFLCAYLRGDLAAAQRHADAIPSAGFHRAYLARALLAAKSGDMAAARESMERLARVQPNWRNDPRSELDKIFPIGATAGYLADDLAAITRSAAK
jgi:tetratricopeptide (TPR) repeat protein